LTQIVSDKAELDKESKWIFAAFDADNSGFIDGKEFENALKQYNKNTKQTLTYSKIKKEADVSFRKENN